MNKRYLPAIASLLIIAITFASLLPVFAALPTRAYTAPTLSVLTIPEDDEARKTGIIFLNDNQADFVALAASPATVTPVAQDLMAEFKLLITYNGVPVNPTSFYCQVVEKDKYNAMKSPQGTWENLKTVPKDMTSNFVCKYRLGKPGVGVLEVYFLGSPAGQYISDYIVVVAFDYVIGRTTVYGTEIQDICVLGWPLQESAAWKITKPDGTHHWVYADPLGDWVSCEDAALYEKALLGLTIPWD
jgi:hypothetical protein